MKNALILAAGKSSRFGRNKLEEEFDGKTLPEIAAEFAVQNGAENVYLTLSRSGVKTDGTRVYHPVLEAVSRVCEPKVRFQSEDSYGPGAAITTWSGLIDGPFTVLFGDNFYRGESSVLKESFGLSSLKETFFTAKYLQANPRNLQLAAIVENFVLEKPHSFIEGDFFCGLVRFPENFLNNVGSLRRSDRGEVEITDMINMSEKREYFYLDDVGLGIEWGDLTYESDISAVRRLIHEGK